MSANYELRQEILDLEDRAHYLFAPTNDPQLEDFERALKVAGWRVLDPYGFEDARSIVRLLGDLLGRMETVAREQAEMDAWCDAEMAKAAAS